MYGMRVVLLGVALFAAATAAPAAESSLIQTRSTHRLRSAGAVEELAEKRKEKKEYEEKIKKVEGENTDTLKQIDAIKGEFAAAAAKAASDPKEKAKHEVRAEVARLQADLKIVNADIKTLQGQVAVFADEYRKVEDEYRGLNSQINELQLDADSANRTVERLEDVKEERSKQVEAVRAEQRVADNDLANITDTNAAREAKLQRGISVVASAAAAIEGKGEKLKAKLEQLKQEVEGLLSAITVNQQKLDTENERTRELKGRHERAVEARKTLTSQLEEHRRLLAEAKARFATAEDALIILRNSTSSLRAEVKTLTAEYRHLSALRANATDEADKLESSTDRLAILVDEANGAIDMLHERVTKESEAIDAEKADHEETATAIGAATVEIRSTLKRLHGAVDRREAAHERARQVTSARFELVRTVARLAISAGPTGGSTEDRDCPCALITVEEAEEAGMTQEEVTALAQCQHDCERRRFCGVQCKRNKAAREAAAAKVEVVEKAKEEAVAEATEAAEPKPEAEAAAETETEIIEKKHEAEEAADMIDGAKAAEERRLASEAAARAHQAAAQALERAAKALSTLSGAAARGDLESVAGVVRETLNSALKDAADALEKAGVEAAKTVKPGKDGSEASRHHATVSSQLVTAATGIANIAKAIISGSDVATLADAEREVVAALQQAADVLDAAGSEAVASAAHAEAEVTGADEEGATETETEKVYSDGAAKAFKEAASIMDSAATEAEKTDIEKNAKEIVNQHKESADTIRSVAASVQEAVAAAQAKAVSEKEADADAAAIDSHAEAEKADGADQVEEQAAEAEAKVDAQIEAAKAKAAAEGEALKAQIKAKAEETKQQIELEAEDAAEDAAEAVEHASEDELEHEVAELPPAPSPAPTEPVVIHDGVSADQIKAIVEAAIEKAQPEEPDLETATADAIEHASETVKSVEDVIASGGSGDVTVAAAATAGADNAPVDPESVMETHEAIEAAANATTAAVEQAKAAATKADEIATNASAALSEDDAAVEAAFLQAHAAAKALREFAEVGALLAWEPEAGSSAAQGSQLSRPRFPRHSHAEDQQTMQAADDAATAASNGTEKTASETADAMANTSSSIFDTVGAIANATGNAAMESAYAAGKAAEAAANATANATNAVAEAATKTEAANATNAAADAATKTEAANATNAVADAATKTEAANATNAAADAATKTEAANATNAAADAATKTEATNTTAAAATTVASNTTAEAAFVQREGRAHHHHGRRLRMSSRVMAHAAAPAAPASNMHSMRLAATLASRPRTQRLRAGQDQNTMAPSTDSAAAAAAASATNATANATATANTTAAPVVASNATNASATVSNATGEPPVETAEINGTQIGQDISAMTGQLATGGEPVRETEKPAAASNVTSGSNTTGSEDGMSASNVQAALTAVGTDGDGDDATADSEEQASMRFLDTMQRNALAAHSMLQTMAMTRRFAARGDEMSDEDAAAIAKAELTGVTSSLTKLKADLQAVGKLKEQYAKELKAKQAKKAEFEALNGQDIGSLKAAKDTLDKAYNSQVNIQTDLTSSRDSTRMQLESAQAKVRDAESVTAGLHSKIERSKRTQKMLQDAIDRLKDEKKTIASNIEAARDRAGNEKSAGLERKLEMMKHRAEQEERKEEATAVQDKLQEAVDEQEGKVEMMHRQVQTLDEYIEGQKTNQSELSDKIATEVDRSAKLTEADAVARSKAEDFQEKMDEAEQEAIETRAAEQDLRAVKQQMLEPQAKIKADLARVRAAIKEHSIKRDELLSASKALDSELNSVRAKYATLNSTLTSLRSSNAQLHSELRQRNATARHLDELVDLNRHETELAARVVADSKSRIQTLEADLLKLQKMDPAVASSMSADSSEHIFPNAEAGAEGDSLDQPGDEATAEDGEKAAEDALASATEGAEDGAVAEGGDSAETGAAQAESEADKIEKAAEAKVAAENGGVEGVSAEVVQEVKAEEAAAENKEEAAAEQAVEMEEQQAAAQVDGAGSVGNALDEAIKEAEAA